MRFVYRDYPLPNHDRAGPAAEAAQCAHEQGRFWEYHDKIFENQKTLADEDLQRFAAEIGLDTARFEQCLSSGRFRGDVQQDYQDGQQAGVTGTPGFFINGRFLNGAQPFEAFQAVIDEELSRAGVS